MQYRAALSLRGNLADDPLNRIPIIKRLKRSFKDIEIHILLSLDTKQWELFSVAKQLCLSDDDVVDRDVDQLHEEPDEAHDGKADRRRGRDLLELWKERTKEEQIRIVMKF